MDEADAGFEAHLQGFFAELGQRGGFEMLAEELALVVVGGREGHEVQGSEAGLFAVADEDDALARARIQMPLQRVEGGLCHGQLAVGTTELVKALHADVQRLWPYRRAKVEESTGLRVNRHAHPLGEVLAIGDGATHADDPDRSFAGLELLEFLLNEARPLDDHFVLG